jgi:hypothetical protein
MILSNRSGIGLFFLELKEVPGKQKHAALITRYFGDRPAACLDISVILVLLR